MVVFALAHGTNQAVRRCGGGPPFWSNHAVSFVLLPTKCSLYVDTD